jgi:DNA-binding CsgD family transcriptional regulator
MLADDMTIVQAARAHGVVYDTVRKHLYHARISLDVHTNTGAVAAALRKGLIT